MVVGMVAIPELYWRDMLSSVPEPRRCTPYSGTIMPTSRLPTLTESIPPSKVLKRGKLTVAVDWAYAMNVDDRTTKLHRFAATESTLLTMHLGLS
jgi:hypothetical protein